MANTLDRVLFGADDMGEWLDDELTPQRPAQEEPKWVKPEVMPQKVAEPIGEKPHLEQAPEPKPEAPTKPAPAKVYKGIRLRIEDLNLHDWIHGTGEVPPPRDEQQDEREGVDHLGLE